MLRHMCPPLGLGKRCPARVAYKVRTSEHSSSREGLFFFFSMASVGVLVVFVLFLFLSVES